MKSKKGMIENYLEELDKNKRIDYLSFCFSNSTQRNNLFDYLITHEEVKAFLLDGKKHIYCAEFQKNFMLHVCGFLATRVFSVLFSTLPFELFRELKVTRIDFRLEKETSFGSDFYDIMFNLKNTDPSFFDIKRKYSDPDNEKDFYENVISTTNRKNSSCYYKFYNYHCSNSVEKTVFEVEFKRTLEKFTEIFEKSTSTTDRVQLRKEFLKELFLREKECWKKIPDSKLKTLFSEDLKQISEKFLEYCFNLEKYRNDISKKTLVEALVKFPSEKFPLMTGSIDRQYSLFGKENRPWVKDKFFFRLLSLRFYILKDWSKRIMNLSVITKETLDDKFWTVKIPNTTLKKIFCSSHHYSEKEFLTDLTACVDYLSKEQVTINLNEKIIWLNLFPLCILDEIDSKPTLSLMYSPYIALTEKLNPPVNWQLFDDFQEFLKKKKKKLKKLYVYEFQIFLWTILTDNTEKKEIPLKDLDLNIASRKKRFEQIYLWIDFIHEQFPYIELSLDEEKQLITSTWTSKETIDSETIDYEMIDSELINSEISSGTPSIYTTTFKTPKLV